MKKNLYRLGMVLAMSAGFALAQSSAAPTTTPKTFPDQQSSSSADKSAQSPTSAQPQSSDQSSSSSQLPSSSDQKSTKPSATSSPSSPSSSMPQSDQGSAATAPSSTPSTSSSSSSSTDQNSTLPSSSSSATQSADQKSSDQKSTAPSTGVQAGASASGLPQNDVTGGSDLQSKIQSAFSQNNLSGVTVSAADDKKIELSGTVNSKKERKEAIRIAKENANGKKVVDHIQVSASANAGATSH
jgi:hypothetical protein